MTDAAWASGDLSPLGGKLAAITKKHRPRRSTCSPTNRPQFETMQGKKIQGSADPTRIRRRRLTSTGPGGNTSSAKDRGPRAAEGHVS